MPGISEGQHISATVQLRQPPEVSFRQFMTIASTAQDSSMLQTGPMELTLTRTYWPTEYLVIAVVGFFLCLIGPLILISNKQELLYLRVESGPEPGTSTVTVSGKADKAVAAGMMAMLAQGAFVGPAVGFPVVNSMMSSTTVTTTVQMSDDRNYWWDGSAWQPAATSMPPGAQLSPDRTQWWDGAGWRSVPGLMHPQ